MHVGCICQGVCPFEYFGLSCSVSRRIVCQHFAEGVQYRWAEHVFMKSSELCIKKSTETKIQWETHTPFPVIPLQIFARAVQKAKGF